MACISSNRVSIRVQDLIYKYVYKQNKKQVNYFNYAKPIGFTTSNQFNHNQGFLLGLHSNLLIHRVLNKHKVGLIFLA